MRYVGRNQEGRRLEGLALAGVLPSSAGGVCDPPRMICTVMKCKNKMSALAGAAQLRASANSDC